MPRAVRPESLTSTAESLTRTTRTLVLPQVLFEGFHVPAVHIASEGVLSLYASGLTTGLVLTMGETQTTALPVIEGNAAHLAGQVNPSLTLTL